MNHLDFHNNFHGFDSEVRTDKGSDAFSLLAERSHELKDMSLYDQFSSRAFYLYYTPSDSKTDDDFISFCEEFITMDNYKKTFQSKDLFNSYLFNYRIAETILANKNNIYKYSEEMKSSWFSLISEFFRSKNKHNRLAADTDPSLIKRSPEIFRIIKLNEFAEHGKPNEKFIDFLEREWSDVDRKCRSFNFVNYSKASELIFKMRGLGQAIVNKKRFDEDIIEAYYNLCKEDIPYFIQKSNSQLSISSDETKLFLEDKLLWLKFRINRLEIANGIELKFYTSFITKAMSESLAKEYRLNELVSIGKDFSLETYLILRKIYDKSNLNSLNYEEQELFYKGLSSLSKSNSERDLIRIYSFDEKQSVDFNFLVSLVIESEKSNEVLNLKSFIDYDSEKWEETPTSWHLAQMV